MKTFAKFMIGIGLCGHLSTAQADDTVTTEAQPLGGLFLSVDERRRLDARRVAVPLEVVPASRPVGENIDRPSAKRRQAVGYIVGPSGRRSTWANGDFRPTNSTSSSRHLRLSGSIVIGVRKTPTAGGPHSPAAISVSEGSPPETSSAASASTDDAGEH